MIDNRWVFGILGLLVMAGPIVYVLVELKRRAPRPLANNVGVVVLAVVALGLLILGFC